MFCSSARRIPGEIDLRERRLHEDRGFVGFGHRLFFVDSPSYSIRGLDG